MESRKEQEYSLPDVKPKDAPRKPKKGKKGAPVDPSKVRQSGEMPPSEVKAGWSGPSREEVLHEPSILPDFVRALPRMYLVPPRPSHQQQHQRSGLHGLKAQAEAKKRSSQSAFGEPFGMTPTAATGPSSFTPAAAAHTTTGLSPMPAAPRIAGEGEAVSTTLLHATGGVMHQYESGAQLFRPPPVAVSGPYMMAKGVYLIK